MSVCGPHNQCSKCRDDLAYVHSRPPVTMTPHSGRPAGKCKDKREIEDLEHLLAELKEIRKQARRLMRSGHPGVREEAHNHLRKAEDNIRWLKVRMTGEVVDA